jgi:uncharacterized coiled-coil DUF342 family protein
MRKLTIEDWESPLMDRISNNVTQDYGHELEKIDYLSDDDDQIHEILTMIMAGNYEYEKIIERLNNEISEHKENINALCDRLDEYENVNY